MDNPLPSQNILFRYDAPNISALILEGSIRISTLEACRTAENAAARDPGEGSKTITSLPGTNAPSEAAFAQMLGVDRAGIKFEGSNAVITVGENAIRRTENAGNAFVFCTSMAPNDGGMKAKFGGSCLKIKDTAAFFELLDKHLRQKVGADRLGKCTVGAVLYAQRTNNYRDHTDKHPAFIKPPGGNTGFETEAEIRAIWIPKGFVAEPVYLRIPEISAVLELLQ